MEVGEEGFESVGVHVWSGYCGGETNSLGGVGVRCVGSEVGAVDLWEAGVLVVVDVECWKRLEGSVEEVEGA